MLSTDGARRSTAGSECKLELGKCTSINRPRANLALMHPDPMR